MKKFGEKFEDAREGAALEQMATVQVSASANVQGVAEVQVLVCRHGLVVYAVSHDLIFMAQITPIRGFSNTPVSRSVCVLTTVIAIAVAVLQYKHYFVLAIDPFIVEYGQYWRVASYQFSVINESDFLLTVLLWFQFKTLERFFGSRKYLSVISLFLLYNGVLCFVVMSLGQLLVNVAMYFVSKLNLPLISLAFSAQYQATFLNRVIPGPLGVISSLYICYGKYIPVSYYFKIQLSAEENGAEGEQNNQGNATLLAAEAAAAAATSRHEHGAPASASTPSASVPSSPRSPVSAESTPSAPGLFSELNLTNHFQIHAIYTLLLINNGIHSMIPCVVGIVVGKLFISDLLVGSNRWSVPLPIYYVVSSPSKAWSRYTGLLQLRLGGYHPVRTEEEPEEVNDDVRSTEGVGIRAETPVRPLGSQFLDTFRT